jgi:putative phosphoesterase
MKVAVISDIHGNLYALERVIEAIEREAPGEIVCLGDVIAFGPQPREVLRRLRELGCPVVMGNCDVWFPQWPLPPEEGLIYAQARWAAEQLPPEDVAFIAGFRPTVSVSLGGGQTLLCFHGSPRSNTEVILATTPDEELTEMLAGGEGTVMIGGHTHTQMVRRLPGRLLMNAGSVGMPFDTDRSVHPAWAEWAIVEAADGSVTVSLRRTPLDAAEMTARAAGSSMPGLDEWIESRRS